MIFIFTIYSFTTNNRIDEIISKEIKSVFDIETFSKLNIEINDETNKTLPIKISKNSLFKIISNNQTIGYYYLGKSFGKMDFFDFIIIFDKELNVSKIRVLKYREEHGGEIGSKRWLKQFIGLKTDKSIENQKNIMGISGATLSVNSITKEINLVFKCIDILNNKNLLK